MKNIPHLEDINGKKRLMVQGKPFIILGGEVHNSASSSVADMEKAWEKAECLGMNTLLVPVTWELIEPKEGQFDFSMADALISGARERNKKLSILWFGAWKNAQCYYAPEWVKRDLSRFRRAEMVKGQNFIRRQDFYGMPYTTLSYLCEETCRADAKAFAALMKHIRETDASENTVISVQVENETGVMAFAREHSDEADALFFGQVPADFAAWMKQHTETMVPDVRSAVESGKDSGTWEEVFGPVSEELFSAYYTATYVNTVAKAGKAEYPLPMTANCWLDKGGTPGSYPSGGPVSRVYEVWKYCAPEIDVIAPDIYVPDFLEICDEYSRRGNPLYIPETATHSYAASREMYAIGHYHALCYSPFGFEEMSLPFNAQQSFLFGVDVTDSALKTPQNVFEYGAVTRMLDSLTPMLAENYGTDALQAACSERPEENIMNFGTFSFQVSFDSPVLPGKNGACLILKASEDTFFAIVNCVALNWYSVDPANPNVDILELEDGTIQDGKWIRNRRLNGDEAVITSYPEPTLLKIRLMAYS